MTHTSQDPSGKWQTIKRTFWFGTLGALAVLPLPLSLILSFLFDRPYDSEFLMPLRDAAFYHYLGAMFPGGYVQAARFCTIVIWGLAILIAVRMRFLTLERLKFWRAASGYKKRHRGDLPGFLARLGVALLFLIAGSGSGLDMFFYYPPDTITHMQSSFGGASGAAATFLFPAVQMSGYGFLIAVMVYAVVTPVSMMEFIKKALVGGAAMAGSMAALFAAGYYLDMNRYLGDIPGMTAAPEPRTFVLLDRAPVYMPILTDYRDCPASGKFCMKVESTEANEEAVGAYLETRGFNTVLRGPGLGFMANCRLMELDPAGALNIYKKALDITRDKTHGLMLVTRLVYAPATAVYREVLDEVAGSGNYQVTGRAALRVSRAYVRFGEMEKAKIWHDAGMRTAGPLDDDAIRLYRVPEEPPFFSGRITGGVTVDGQPAEGLRAGLMTVNACRNMMLFKTDGKRVIIPFYDLQPLTDGTATDKDGRFAFEGLGEGEYILLLSLKDPATGRYRALTSPGVVTVSSNRPDADAGVVRLVAERS
jgi:hypothetical protein